MIIKDIVEDTLTKKHTNTYELSIRIGVDSFDYMVLSANQEVLALKSYGLEKEAGSHLAAIEALFQAEKFLHQPFRNIRVGLVSGRNTLIPLRLYDPARKDMYLQQITELKAGEETRADALPVLNLHNVYAVNADEIAMARRLFPGCRFFHIGTALLEGMRHQAAQHEGFSVFAHLKGGMLYLILFDGKDLQFANAFPYQAAKDFIYFVLLVFQQFGLQPETQPLYLSGQFVQDSEIYREAVRYVRHLEFLPAPAFFQFGPRLSQEPHYLYFGLLSLSLCS